MVQIHLNWSFVDVVLYFDLVHFWQLNYGELCEWKRINIIDDLQFSKESRSENKL